MKHPCGLGPASWEGAGKERTRGAWQTHDEQETAVCPGSNKTEPSSGPC